MISHNIYKIDPSHPDKSLIYKAADIIRSHGSVIFPTQSFYGLAVNAAHENSVINVFNMKQRPLDKPILLLIDDISRLAQLTKEIPEPAKQLMQAYWPGDLTLIFDAHQTVLACLTAQSNKIGIRLPKHPVAYQLVKAAQMPITGTSANLSGDAGACQINEIAPAVISKADMVLDAGKLRGGKGSTIIDITTMPPLVIREGNLNTQKIFKNLSILL